MINWNITAEPQSFSFAEQYAFSTVRTLDDEAGMLGLGYFDREDGEIALGTRRTISGLSSSKGECQAALETLRKMQEKRGVHLPFKLADICGEQRTGLASLQQHLGL